MITAKMQTSQSKKYWNYQVKNMVVLDRLIDEDLFLTDIAELKLQNVENFQPKEEKYSTSYSYITLTHPVNSQKKAWRVRPAILQIHQGKGLPIPQQKILNAREKGQAQGPLHHLRRDRDPQGERASQQFLYSSDGCISLFRVNNNVFIGYTHWI